MATELEFVRERIEKMCDEYLAGLRCTLWGQPFEIISAKGRAQAVQWLADQIEAMARMEESRESRGSRG